MTRDPTVGASYVAWSLSAKPSPPVSCVSVTRTAKHGRLQVVTEQVRDIINDLQNPVLLLYRAKSLIPLLIFIQRMLAGEWNLGRNLKKSGPKALQRLHRRLHKSRTV